ncbi:MAG: T9SS type A sorting domain-containing protein [Candidatus Electryonea clarkiae]|nr:T9SS type A sorting domain-containing protein [Candidatus Electryonea clarkiae]MDP8286057.1 T9SS type A sorting domain-containing protein [Candidatus Electryonea clarkiae]
MYGLKKYRRALLVVAFLALIAQVYAQDSLGTSLLDGLQSIDNFYDVALAGDYALIAAGSSGLLVVYDPAGEPEIVAQVGERIEIVSTVKIQGDRALTTGSYLTYYDISNPTDPEIIWQIDNNTELYNEWSVWKDNLIVNDGMYEIIIREINDESQSEELSSISKRDDNQFGYRLSCQIKDNYLIAVCDIEYYHPTFRVWNLTDPENPEQIVSTVMEEMDSIDPFEINVNGELMVLGTYETIYFFNIESLESPELFSRITISGFGSSHNEMNFLDDRVFVFTNYNRHIKSISLEDLNNPEISETLVRGCGGECGFDVTTSTLVFADFFGLQSCDITDPDNFGEICRFEPFERWYGLRNLGDLLIMSYGFYEREYMRFDFSGRNELENIGSFNPEREGFDHYGINPYKDDILVFQWSDWNNDDGGFETLDYQFQLATIDPNDNLDIVFRGELPALDDWLAIYSDEAIYEAGQDTSHRHPYLKIWDITDLDAPVMTNVLNIDGDIIARPMVYEDYLYLLIDYEAMDRSLAIYSLDNPFAPEILVDMTLDPWYLRESIIIEDLIFFKGSSSYIIYSLADPEDPMPLNSTHFYHYNYDILDYHDNKLLLGYDPGREAALKYYQVYDISDIENPELIACYPVQGWPSLGHLDGDRILASWGLGYGVFAFGENSVGQNKISVLPLNSFLDVYPNPANPGSVVSVNLAQSGLLTLELYDLLGRRIARLANENYQAGNHRFNINDLMLPTSGSYYLTARSEDQSETRRIVMLK